MTPLQTADKVISKPSSFDGGFLLFKSHATHSTTQTTDVRSSLHRVLGSFCKISKCFIHSKDSEGLSVF
jgi:hypothetical protein